MRRITFLMFALIMPVVVLSQDRITGHDFATRSEVIARNGMAATSQPLATQVALDILKKGGTAIDAAIAADAVLGVVEPTGAGVGGDIFAIIWSADKGKLYGLNGSGRSPRSLKLEYFKQNGYEFVKGSIAKDIASFMKKQGGFLSYDDLYRHHSEWVEPVSTNYRGYEVWELPPNGQGIAALQMLNILEGYDIAAMGFGSADYIHVFTEAKKLAFEDRAKYYADPFFSKTPVSQLLSKKYAAERRKLIDREKAAKIYDPGRIEAANTIYLTVADKYGNMVSLIQSNYRGMGSGMCPTGLGFVLQDRGEMFRLDDGHNNVYAPGKRPFHTIIPAFITKNNKPWISFGVMGGDMQPQGHVQIVVNLIDFKMNLQEAGDAPRMHHIGSSEPTGQQMTNGGILLLESGFRTEVIQKLMSMGHVIQWDLGGYGGYQAIMWDAKNRVWFGASESRKDGQASGY